MSCCTDMIELEVEDVAMNKMRTTLRLDTEAHWNIILPIVVTVAIVVLIIIIAIVVCACKNGYKQVNSQYV